MLLKHSADVNSRDKYWQTPLHIAAANKAVRCAEALIPLLSNVNVSERAGRTALHHAAFSGHLEVRKNFDEQGSRHSGSMVEVKEEQEENAAWKQEL